MIINQLMFHYLTFSDLSDVKTKELEEVEHDWRSGLRKASVVEGPEALMAEEVHLKPVQRAPSEELVLPERLTPEMVSYCAWFMFL